MVLQRSVYQLVLTIPTPCQTRQGVGGWSHHRGNIAETNR